MRLMSTAKLKQMLSHRDMWLLSQNNMALAANTSNDTLLHAINTTLRCASTDNKSY